MRKFEKSNDRIDRLEGQVEVLEHAVKVIAWLHAEQANALGRMMAITLLENVARRKASGQMAARPPMAVIQPTSES